MIYVIFKSNIVTFFFCNPKNVIIIFFLYPDFFINLDTISNYYQKTHMLSNNNFKAKLIILNKKLIRKTMHKISKVMHLKN